VSSNFKLIKKSDPHTYFETQQDSFLLGKSEKCEIVITDPHIAEVQAKVGKKDEKYVIKNVGKDPIQINGRPALVKVLENGDEITLGKTKFLLQLPNTNEELAKTVTFEAKTMVMNSPSNASSGPRLVCTNSAGKSKTYPLKKDKVVIGRSGEAHLQLVHPLVSRKHCVIEKQNNAFNVRNISTTNPIYVNHQGISEKRLYHGDQLKIGTFSLTYLSDRPEDVKTVKMRVETKNKRSGWGLWVAMVLVLTFGGYFAYLHAYAPWKIKQSLQSVAKLIETEHYVSAQKTLKRLLTTNLSPHDAQEARELLAQTTLAITRLKAKNESVEKAKKYLMAYLAEYGTGKESQMLWDRLDFYRLSLGKRFEGNEEFDMALRQYAAIREDSLYYDEAQKAVRRIWLAKQQPSREEQTVTQLLKEAENHFNAKRYLTPVNQNAYSVYQAILALEPQHQLALRQIEKIKMFYREYGEKYYKKKQWRRALSYFERYYFIDPEAPDIKKKIKTCRNKLIASRKSPQKTKRNKSVPAQKSNENREEVKRLLEESGTESSWLMQYLFEDQEGEEKSETPW
jgi:pSer/pThr/pTyr-binding forkhead associated (FHA) protein